MRVFAHLPRLPNCEGSKQQELVQKQAVICFNCVHRSHSRCCCRFTCHIAVVFAPDGIGRPGAFDDWYTLLMEFCTGLDCKIDVCASCVHLLWVKMVWASVLSSSFCLCLCLTVVTEFMVIGFRC